ncbi:carboxyltransferase domain-containing protein [Kamptonema cortianum]|nr:carboxyltransferase domain-containing protein [Geitlerinema splendidum]MDK3155247.1 carboxyltransferase domain-containing protein [Kamptonema cortianum]
MLLEPLGECAFIMRDLPGPAPLVARVITQLCIPGVKEVVPAYETVGIYVDPFSFNIRLFEELQLEMQSAAFVAKEHLIPVRYDGEDLYAAADSLRISHRDLALTHAGVPYDCKAIGFCPGFPYLGYLPETLSGLDRLPSPRSRVPAGSVAITGRQTGIYTMERPGGWWLIGRTPLVLVDVDDGYFPIRPGDTVQFQSIDDQAFERLRGDRL